MNDDAKKNTEERRSFLSTAGGLGAVGGLLVGYGTFGAFALRFLYPARPSPKGWQFVRQARKIAVGEAIRYTAPGGAEITIARRADAGSSEDFIALSSTCPHLGCQVHWEAHNNRFFCPCHNGVFDPTGKALEGPPAEAGQSLPRYPLKIEDGLLFIEVPFEGLVSARRCLTRPGHDACLQPVSDKEEA